jgi:PAS domain S-box-containing protein
VEQPPNRLPLDPEIAHRLTLVASQTEVAVVLGDAGGCVQWVNEAFSRLTGYEAKEVTGKRLDLFSGDRETGADVLDFVLGRFARGEASKLEIPARTRSGHEIWLAIEVQPLREPDGSGAGFLLLANDVTERKQAERALAESEERYRQLVELSPEPIAVHCDGRFVFLNEVAGHLLGAEHPEALLGRPVMSVVHPGDREQVERRVRGILETGEPTAFHEVRIVRLDGRLLEAEIAGARVQHGGRPAVQLVARDLTQRRQVEVERQAVSSRVREAQHAERLSTLAGGMAHDLNNLLATILGEVDLALTDVRDEAPVRDGLHSIRRESLRAARLTSQLLAYAGKGGVAQERTDVSTLVMQASELLEAAVSERVILNLDLAGNLPVVLGDSIRLREVLVELVSNSMEALQGEEGTLTVRTSLEQEPHPTRPGKQQHWVRLEVIDTGCGMSRETCARVFEPFFTTKFAGRGLGLAAAQGIIHAHRGTIRVESQLSRGSRVVVRLPAARASEAPSRRRRRRASLASAARTVLVVDDEDALRNVARRLLEREGFQVRTASSGSEALRMFRARSGEIGVVLLDLTMPGMDGAETLRELRLVQPGVRVVLMTGYGDVADRVALEDLSGFLPKPYDPPALVEAIRRALGR